MRMDEVARSPTEHAVDVGALVRDRKPADFDQDQLVVVECFETPAAAFEVAATGRTVAADNPAYPADDRVVAAVWVADARSKRYHFPRSRLVRADRIRQCAPAALSPSPLHARTFDRAANADYIAEIEEAGAFGSFLVARETPTGLELLEGHKRRWVALEAGLETVDVIRVEDVTDRAAAQWYVRDHWAALDEAARAAVRRRAAAWLPGGDDWLSELVGE